MITPRSIRIIKNATVIRKLQGPSKVKFRNRRTEIIYRHSTDKELVEIAELDLESISESIDNEVNVIKEELIVPEKYDAENAMMEVVPGAGGQEASLRRADIQFLHFSFVQDIGCDIEIVEVTKIQQKFQGYQVLSGITKRCLRLSVGTMLQCSNTMKFHSRGAQSPEGAGDGTKNDRLQTRPAAWPCCPK